jgi:hypothetical protein
MKIYVHNYFNTPFFITLAHNSTNRIFDLDDKGRIGNVSCEYKGDRFEFVFDPNLNDNTDGYHLIDFFSILRNHTDYENFKDIELEQEGNDADIQIIERIIELLDGKENWIFFYLRTEKILSKIDIPDLKSTTDATKYSYLQKMVIIDDLLNKLNNHNIISDNVFLNEVLESKYSNYYHTFTNSVYNWNYLTSIRWFYEFKDVFENLNKPYDIGFAVRRLKGNRRELLKNLKKLQDDRIFLSFTDYCLSNRETFDKYSNQFVEYGIHFNSKNGVNDFENIEVIKNMDPIGLDFFFRILTKSKVQILDESWAWMPRTFTHQYISEKTLGYVLSGIPFISTHSYPLDILEKVLQTEKHPFYNQTKECNGDPLKFSNFVQSFLNNFESNHKICLDWSKSVNEKISIKITTENSFLDLIRDGFQSSNTVKPIRLI